MSDKISLKERGKALISDIKTHWDKPAAGKFVPYKEYLSVFGGVSFNYGMNTPASYIGFAASCYLIMYHYQLPYLAYTIISLIGMPIGYLWTFLSWIVSDNLGFMPKKTERRVYIIYCAAMALGIMFMLVDFSTFMDSGSSLYKSINSLSGVNVKTIFNIFGVQLFVNGFSGLRNVFWRKKLTKKYGRYKYQLYSTVWQRAIMFILVGWLPIYKIADVNERVWLTYLLMSIFSTYSVANCLGNCADMISPNSQERIMIRTWPQKFGHFFNAVLEFIVPVIIAWFPNSFADIGVYRYVLPATYILCAVMTMIFAPKIRERIPQPPLEKKVNIGFWDGVFGVMRNKYRWIDTISSLLDSLGNGMLALTTVIYLYTMRIDGIVFSIVVAIISFSGFVPALLTPYFIKRFTYRQIRIFNQLLAGLASSLYIVIILSCGTNYTLCGSLIIVVMFFYGICAEVPVVAKEDMSYRLEDYQMYLSGERLTNFNGIFTIIISPITTLISLIIPLLLLKEGYNTNWDILFVDSARMKIIIIPIIIDTAGHFLMAIPYLFWDYDNKKHDAVIKELQRRAHILGGEDFSVHEDKAPVESAEQAAATTDIGADNDK